MKNLSLLLALGLVFTSVPTLAQAAGDCAYCGQMNDLFKGFKKYPFNPNDEATAGKQDELVDQSMALLKRILKEAKGEPSDDDILRIADVLARVSPYDAMDDAGVTVMQGLGKHADAFFASVHRLREAKKMSEKNFQATIEGVAIAEQVRDHGTDGDGK